MSKCSYCVYRNGWDCGDGYYRVSDYSLCENFKLDFDTLSDEQKKAVQIAIYCLEKGADMRGEKDG